MNNEDVTSVLLPSSGVDFFAISGESIKLAESLRKDWRFARVSVEVAATGMTGAIEKYHELVSPELIVVETDNIDSSFISQLEELSSLCSKNTDAIVIGPKNDVQLYRSLMEMGIKDYLVNPVEHKDMVKAIAKFLIEKRGISGSKLISVINSKGGAGATSVAQLLAYDLAENLKQKTVLVDVSGGISNTGLTFGLEAVASLTDIVRLASDGTDDDMKRVCQNAGENLTLLLSGAEPVFNDIPDPDKVEGLLKNLMKKYPIVVVDLSASSRSVQKRMIELSSRVVTVTNATVSALRGAKILLSEIGRMRTGLSEVDLVVNMQGMAGGDEVPLADIKSALDIEPTTVIAYLPKAFVNSETSGTPIGRKPENDRILAKIRNVSEKIADQRVRGEQTSAGKDAEKPAVGFFKKLFKE